MACDVGDVREAVLICDGYGGAIWTQLTSDCFGFRRRDAYRVSYGKIERKIFDVSRIILQLELRRDDA